MAIDRPSAPDSHPELAAVAALLAGCSVPWCVAGGWALDLFLGRPTRPHADVDVAVFRVDQQRLRRHLGGWSFEKVIGGAFTEWADGEWLEPPVHEVHARSPSGDALEILLNDSGGDDWIYRRDPRIRCPAGRVIAHTADGLPYLCPAVVLLYKSKSPRAVDEADFRAARAALPAAQRRWLMDALDLIHPEHPWLAELRAHPS